jgi:hypothetical protein
MQCCLLAHALADELLYVVRWPGMADRKIRCSPKKRRDASYREPNVGVPGEVDVHRTEDHRSRLKRVFASTSSLTTLKSIHSTSSPAFEGSTLVMIRTRDAGSRVRTSCAPAVHRHLFKHAMSHLFTMLNRV